MRKKSTMANLTLIASYNFWGIKTHVSLMNLSTNTYMFLEQLRVFPLSVTFSLDPRAPHSHCARDTDLLEAL